MAGCFELNTAGGSLRSSPVYFAQTNLKAQNIKTDSRVFPGFPAS